MYLSHLLRCGIYLIGYYILRSRARNRSGLGIFTPWLVSKKCRNPEGPPRGNALMRISCGAERYRVLRDQELQWDGIPNGVASFHTAIGEAVWELHIGYLKTPSYKSLQGYGYGCAQGEMINKKREVFHVTRD